MSFENKSGLNVSNHYGPRKVGGTVGSQETTNSSRIFTIDLDGEAQPAAVKIAAGTLIQNVLFEGTAGSAKVNVGSLNVTAATYAAPVKVVTAGALTFVKGSGTGKVKVMAVTPVA